MKQVWQANDGSIHETASQADERDTLLQEINDLVAPLYPPDLDRLSFINGHLGPIQLTAEQHDTFIEGYLGLVKRCCSDELYRKAVRHPDGFVGRYLCDGDSPLYQLWAIASCIDDKHRLWGQTYFKLQAEKREQR